jgi:hypothetical protein
MCCSRFVRRLRRGNQCFLLTPERTRFVDKVINQTVILPSFQGLEKADSENENLESR